MNLRRTIRQIAQQNMLLDGSKAETFVLVMRSSISQLSMRNTIPGQMYVFMFVQDATGKHKVQWGSDMQAGALIDPAPNAITVQAFVGLQGKTILAVPPGTWTEAP